MADGLARHSVQVNARHNVSASHALACDTFLMDNELFLRLVDVLTAMKDDGKSLSQMSLDAGFGRNYVQQLIKNKKQPTLPKITALLDLLSDDQAIYVMTGLRITTDDLEMLRVLSGQSGEVKQAIRLILESAKESEPS